MNETARQRARDLWTTPEFGQAQRRRKKKAEFMLDVGPECVRRNQNGRTSNAIAGEVAEGFMFWSNGKHRFGCILNRLTTTALQEVTSNRPA